MPNGKSSTVYFRNRHLVEMAEAVHGGIDGRC